MENATPEVPVPANTTKTVENAESPDTTSAQGTESTATKQEVKEAERKFKLKFGKQERELSEKDMIAWAQKGWASDERFQTASKKEKDIQTLVAKFKEDPDALIRHLGEDPVEIYKRQLAKELKRKVMTPEQRELEDAKLKLKEFEDERRERDERDHEERVTRLQEKYEQQYDKEMSEAIAASGLPKTPKTVKRCAEIAYRNLQQGYDLPWSTIMEVVRSEYQEDMKELFGAADPEKLVELFGEDVAKKMTTASLKKRIAVPEPITQETRKVAGGEAGQKDSKYASSDDWEEKMKKFKGS